MNLTQGRDEINRLINDINATYRTSMELADKASDRAISKLKEENEEKKYDIDALIKENEELKAENKLLKAQLRKFGEIFDNFNNNKKGERT